MPQPTAVRTSVAAGLHALDAAQQRHACTALPLAVLKKFSDDGGGQLAGLIAYYGFFSLFPLLLVFVTILGAVLHGDLALQHRIVDSSLASFPIIGHQLRTSIHSLNGGGIPLAVGLLATLLAGLGATHATHIAQDRMWRVADHERHSFWRWRARGLALLAVLGLVNVVTTVLDGFVVSGNGALATAGALCVSLVLDLALFVAVMVLLTSYPATVREVLPGALLATVAWEGLQHLGSWLVLHPLRNLSDTYSLFAVVLGTLAWLHIGAQTTLYAAELNVVRAQRLWPRSLLS